MFRRRKLALFLLNVPILLKKNKTLELIFLLFKLFTCQVIGLQTLSGNCIFPKRFNLIFTQLRHVILQNFTISKFDTKRSSGS